MAPLTGLFGTNSSGKTAILQFLLMLKQTIESSDRKRVLDLGDENSYVHLGDTLNLIHKHDFSNMLEYSIQWDSTIEDFDLEESLQPDMSIEEKYIRVMSNLQFESTIYADPENIWVDSFFYSFLNEENNTQFSSDELGRVCLGVRAGQREDLGDLISYSIVSNKTDDGIFATTAPPIKNYGFPSSAFQTRTLTLVSTTQNPIVVDAMSRLSTSFEDVFRSIYYLGPIRDAPTRYHSWSGEAPYDVGKRGELVVPAILAAEKNNSKVEENIAAALKKLGLISSFTVQKVAEGLRLYEVKVKRNDASVEVSITDVGFGVSQILPVIALCYCVPSGSTLIFEEPEMHLHPSAQSELADIFLDVIKDRNLQIVIESHSEHLLRRLQRRIAEEKIDSDDAALYFCNMGDDGASTLLPLELDTYGNINNWPKGFFGDEMGELFAMSEAAFERQMREEKAN